MSKHWTGICLEIILLAGGLSGCQSLEEFNLPPTTSPTSTVQPILVDPSSLTSIEKEIYQQVNQYRLARNLPPLKLDPQISQQARIHSERMAVGAIPFSNEGFEQRVKIIGITISSQQAAENIAMHQSLSNPATSAVKEWIANPNYQKNMIGKFDLTGIGVAQNATGKYYLTQIFIQASPSPLSPTIGIDKSRILEQNLNKSSKKSSRLDTASLATLEQETYRQVNQYRLSQNLPPLQVDERISQVARAHSQDMAKGIATFSHDGFAQRVKAISKKIPYQKAGENLAVNQGYSDPVAVSVQGWIKSPGHRQNMEGNFHLTGVGVAKNAKGEYYFTQLFILEP